MDLCQKKKPNITYQIDSPEFPYDSDSGQSSIKFYHHGKLFFNGGTAPEGTVVEVSFIDFEKSTPPDHVAEIFERSRKASHDRVMRPWFFTYDGNLGKHILCYDRFTKILPENSPIWLSQPRLPTVIPGLPNPTLKREIRELAMGLKHLHDNDVSHSALNSPLSYVLSNDKIKMINIDDSKFDFWDEHDPGASDKQWQKRKRRHINQFGTGLEYLLRSESDWPERDSFLRCFALSVSLDRYLKMVYTHPFLMEDMKKILQLLADAHHAYITKEGGGLRVDILNSAFEEKVLDPEYLRTGVGWRRQMCTEFTKIIQFVRTTPPPPQSSGSPHPPQSSGSPHPHLRNRAPFPPPQSGSHPPQSTRGTSGSPHPQSGSHHPQSTRGTSGSPHPQSGSHPPQSTRGTSGYPHPQSGSHHPQSTRGTSGSPHPQSGSRHPQSAIGSHHSYAGTSQPSTSTSATAPTTTTPPDQYETNVMSELLRFLRNVFEHYHQQNMSLSAVYKEVMEHWPHFVDRIHERV